MTIALQRDKNKDTIFFDAVTNYTQTYQSTLTKHPIDGLLPNGNYTANDHIVNENPTIVLKGIFSSADFNAGRPTPGSFTLVNDNPLDSQVSVLSVGNTILDKVIGALTPLGRPSPPEVILATRSMDVLPAVKKLLLDIRNKRELLTLLEFTGGKQVGESISNLVITNLSFPEEVNTGDALVVDITLAQANFVTLEVTQVHANVVGSLADKAGATDYKAAQSAIVNGNVYESITKPFVKAIDGLSTGIQNSTDSWTLLKNFGKTIGENAEELMKQ